jgi:hypothetical protein
MTKVRDDLSRWGERGRKTLKGAAVGVAGATGGGLAGEMRRPVNLVAITPTRQEMKSTVGREVGSLPFDADFKLWFCSLHAIHHFSMLRTIAVHELVRPPPYLHLMPQGLELPVEFGTAPSTLL